MTEAVFPLLGTAFVVVVVLPVFALLAKMGLMLVERDEVGGALHGLNLRYVILTGSSAMPLAWFVSAALHQAESGRSAIACLVDHDGAARCFEPGFFALTLALVVLVASSPALRRLANVQCSGSVPASVALSRINALIEDRPALRLLRGRVGVTDLSGFALGTYGLVNARVLVGTRFADHLSDDALAGALGHEVEHVRAFDPLRYFVLRLALAVNPLGRFLLEPHVARWQAAREAHCDREAVIHGAAPLPLAEAIVRAARSDVLGAIALGPHDAVVLRFRVEMLLAFAERIPARCCHRGPAAFRTAFALLIVTLLLPHQTSTAALDALHTGAENTITYLWR